MNPTKITIHILMYKNLKIEDSWTVSHCKISQIYVSQKLPHSTKLVLYCLSNLNRAIHCTCRTMMISFVILETFCWKRNCFQVKMYNTILSLNQVKHSIRTHNTLSLHVLMTALPITYTNKHLWWTNVTTGRHATSK